jgi:hypothetical protein
MSSNLLVCIAEKQCMQVETESSDGNAKTDLT